MVMSLSGSSRSTRKNHISLRATPTTFSHTHRRPDQLWTGHLGRFTNPVPVLGPWRFVTLGHKKEPLSQEHKQRLEEWSTWQHHQAWMLAVPVAASQFLPAALPSRLHHNNIGGIQQFR